MKVIIKDNQKRYKYSKLKISEGERLSIILFVTSFLLVLISIIISFFYEGEAPAIVGGMGVASIICILGSMAFSISEIYLYRSYTYTTRNMIFLQIISLLFWMFSL